MFKGILDIFAGRKLLQTPFELLYRLAVYGMNYGNGGDYRESGEEYVIQYVHRQLTTDPSPVVLFDVGANKGGYTLELHKRFANKPHQIYSFEPSVNTFNTLVANIPVTNQIKPVNLGLGRSAETIRLYTNAPNSGWASLYERQLDHIGVVMDHHEEVHIDTIDAYCERNAITYIHFLKLDIEGHELPCLQGARQMLANRRIKFIQFESGGCNIDSKVFFRDFWTLLHTDYSFYRIVRDGLYPIADYREYLEIFQNVNFFLELKPA